MSRKSKPKGNANEAKLAKILSDWAEKPFKRIPSSGSLRWGGASWVYGDILPPEGLLVVIECKHYKKVNVEELLGRQKRYSGANTLIAQWWYDEVLADTSRCEKDLGISGVQPMLIFKEDYGRYRLCLRPSFLQEVLSEKKTDIDHLTVNLPMMKPFAIIDLRRFLSLVPVHLFPLTDRFSD